MVQEYSFNTGKIELNYAEGGTQGKPVMVFLHGLTGRLQAYTDDFNEYGLDWHLYAPDLRGHGKSGKPEEGYRLPDYAGDVINFLSEVVGEPVVLVGHSLGALVTLTVAHLAPDRVRALIANDPPLLGDDLRIADYPEARGWFSWVYETMKDQPTFEQVLERGEAINPEASQAELQDMAEQVFGVALGTVKIALDDRQKEGYDLHAGLRTIDCPAMLLYGDYEDSSVVREKDTAEFRQLVPKAVIHKFEHGTHMLWWEEAETRKKYVREFLSKI
ncbi:alpha/beta fold hydrolase [Chloroflexota bacterium]